MDVHIRPMREEDLPQVRAIDRLSFSLPWPESAYRYELFGNPRSILQVAEIAVDDHKPKIVGLIVIWVIIDEAHIATLAVHPDFRGQHISQKLLVSALRAAIENGAHMATLEVRENNLVAQTLYRRFRFTVVGRRPRYYLDNQEDAVIMSVDFHQFNGHANGYLKWIEQAFPLGKTDGR